MGKIKILLYKNLNKMNLIICQAIIPSIFVRISQKEHASSAHKNSKKLGKQ